MKIGIDISQIAYEGTGVGTFVSHLVAEFLKQDAKNQYVLFYSSLRRKFDYSRLQIEGKSKNLQIKTFPIPPTFLDFLWNTLHIFPIEWFIGPVDVFISSDWTQPPSRAKKATILYDLIVYKYPKETAEKIIAVQKRRLHWVKKEVDNIFCISNATKKDAREVLGIPEEKLEVIYPGL